MLSSVFIALDWKFDIVMHMSISRQRLGKHIPEVTLSTIGHSLLRSGPINTQS
jgi:hypothetical protein